jgi:hypothetical protein
MLRKSISYLFWLSVVVSLTNSLMIKNDAAGEVLFFLVPILLVIDLALKYLWKGKTSAVEETNKDEDTKQVLFADVLLEEKPNFQEWVIDHDGRTIRVTNWYSLRYLVGEATLSIDGMEMDSSRALTFSPKKPLLTSENIEVFFAGAFSIKASVTEHGEVIYRDQLSLADKLANRLLYFS